MRRVCIQGTYQHWHARDVLYLFREQRVFYSSVCSHNARDAPIASSQLNQAFPSHNARGALFSTSTAAGHVVGT